MPINRGLAKSPADVIEKKGVYRVARINNDHFVISFLFYGYLYYNYVMLFLLI